MGISAPSKLQLSFAASVWSLVIINQLDFTFLHCKHACLLARARSTALGLP